MTLRERDIAEGFEQYKMDTLFLDVDNPRDDLSLVHAALAGGGSFDSILPPANQVNNLVADLQSSDRGTVFGTSQDGLCSIETGGPSLPSPDYPVIAKKLLSAEE